jgi:hypothetical protein
MASTSKQGPKLSATLAVVWRTFYRDVFDQYRPKLHYMRGPGPKWRAKHARPETSQILVRAAAAAA